MSRISHDGVGVEPLFLGFFGTAVFLLVLNAGLGVCDALVEGKWCSFMSVIAGTGGALPHDPSGEHRGEDSAPKAYAMAA